MTTWNDITDPQLAPGQPPVSSLFKSLRDNPVAIAEGAAGAPRVSVENALETADTNTNNVLRPDGAGGVTTGLAVDSFAACAADGWDGNVYSSSQTMTMSWSLVGDMTQASDIVTVNKAGYYLISVPAFSVIDDGTPKFQLDTGSGFIDVFTSGSSRKSRILYIGAGERFRCYMQYNGPVNPEVDVSLTVAFIGTT